MRTGAWSGWGRARSTASTGSRTKGRSAKRSPAFRRGGKRYVSSSIADFSVRSMISFTGRLTKEGRLSSS
jgi:hypothetical protein